MRAMSVRAHPGGEAERHLSHERHRVRVASQVEGDDLRGAAEDEFRLGGWGVEEGGSREGTHVLRRVLAEGDAEQAVQGLDGAVLRKLACGIMV